MIDFACKQFRLDDVIKCSLMLTRSDFALMEFMLTESDKSFTTHELSEALGFDLSTIQRSVKKLHEGDVIERSQTNLAGGGYTFVYQIVNKRKIREIIMRIVKNWAEKVEHELDNW